MQYAVVFTRKHINGKGTWSRAFGPFDTRSKALTFKKKQFRKMKEEFLWKDERINEECQWQIMQLWDNTGTPYDWPHSIDPEAEEN